MISLDAVTVTVAPGRTLLDDIDLCVSRGEWVALVGANGSGKTTLLKVIASLMAPDAGRVSIASEGERRPRVAMLLQEPDNQLVTSSVRHELELSLPVGTKGDDGSRRLEEASSRFELAGLWGRNPHQLSGGEKQRVALATVWLQEPDVVLLDEPTAFLDPTATAQCIAFIEDMRASGTTVVWASPGGVGLDRADTVACLDAGALVFRGTVSDYRAWPGRSALAFPPPPSPPTPRNNAVTEPPMLEFDRVAFDYGEGEVLSRVDLAVGVGECMGVAGENGSGKSTLLLLAAGVLRPSGGRVERRYARVVSGTRQHVFLLPQSPERMFFAETVLEELTFGLRRLGARGHAARDRAAHALQEVGLVPERCLDQSPFQLSPGEMRRVAFATALVLEPELLLLDEPTASLDPAGVAQLYRLLDRWRRARTTVVIASHDDRVLSACDRILVLDGRATGVRP